MFAWLIGVIARYAIFLAVHHDVFAPNANAFRFYNPDGDEATSTPKANQDTNITVSVTAGDTTVQLRYRIQNATAVAGATTDDFGIHCSHNAGAFSQVGGSTVIIPSGNPASGLNNDSATTNRATDGITDGTGTFVAGEQCTDGLLDNWQLTASNYSEIVYGLTVVAADVTDADTIDFRVALNGGSPGMTNSVTPRITITKAATLTGQAVVGVTSSGGTPQVTTDIAAGTAYMVVVPNGDVPSVPQIKAGQQSSGAAALAAENIAVTGTTITFSQVGGLSPETAYDVWFVQTTSVEDSAAVKADFTTTAFATGMPWLGACVTNTMIGGAGALS